MDTEALPLQGDVDLAFEALREAPPHHEETAGSPS